MLLEALIGLLLFAIGIIGMLGLQAVSMKQTTDSKYRMEASYLANQIIARMWADNANLASYAISGVQTCDKEAVTEVKKWVCSVQSTLPNATKDNSPTISINGSQVTVTVRWQRDTEKDLQHSFIATANINA